MGIPGVPGMDHFSMYEVINMALESAVVIFLMRNEHRLTVLETTINIKLRRAPREEKDEE
jgi:hypothetical protein